MSLEKMISLHPEVGAVNEDLVKAARHAMLSCADACLAEQMDMRQCIRVCLDCADVCAAASRLMVSAPRRISRFRGRRWKRASGPARFAPPNARSMAWSIASCVVPCAANAPAIAARRLRRCNKPPLRVLVEQTRPSGPGKRIISRCSTRAAKS